MKSKKIILGLTGITVIASPLTAIVSCSSEDKDGTLTLKESIFAGREKLEDAIENDLNKGENTGWKTVLALDGHDHSVDDKSFNEFSYAGMKDSVSTNLVPTRDTDNVKPKEGETFDTVYEAQPEKTLIVAPGFLHIDPLSSKKGKASIKNKAVILIDGDVKAKNVASIKYKSHQAGFLVGYMAGVYLNLKYEEFKEGGLKVATFGGLNIEGVTPFMMGFQNGIKYFNKNKPEKYKHNIEFIDNGSKSDYFSGGFAKGGGTQITENLIDKGADLIFPVAGPQTEDAVAVIKKAQAKTRVIGVDVAQEKNKELESHVVFSAMKELKLSVKKMIEVVTGTKTAQDPGYNGFSGFGGLTIGDLDNGLVGVSQGKSSDTHVKTAYDEANAKTIKDAAKDPKVNPLSFDY